jgi:hypothetical protein
MPNYSSKNKKQGTGGVPLRHKYLVLLFNEPCLEEQVSRELPYAREEADLKIETQISSSNYLLIRDQISHSGMATNANSNKNKFFVYM